MRISKQRKDTTRCNQSGFTLIESLMAIIVVAILLAAITPVIVLAVANRVQAKRVEQATNAAKTYIDAVRSGAVDAPPINDAVRPLNQINPPGTGALNCTANAYCTVPAATAGYQVFCVDGDGLPAGTPACTTDSLKDMIVQASGYQDNASTATTNATKAISGYKLGIRVYRADAFKDAGRTLTTAGAGAKEQATVTAGNGLTSRQAPLVEMTTEIVTDKTKYTDLCSRINTSGSCN
ncbi:MAG: prepilin-type N-terminal cleavage/methylation domain-containing protein [Microcoleus sp. SIO2G3]|nr:prepilin-type N-terminal cleavage/methylation domain-containing protein [Microcoleus sp. SIO2G3]